MVARRREEHLRLVLEAPELFAVNDAVAVALERRPHVVLGLLAETSARVRALGRLGGEDLALARFELLANRGHTINTELTEKTR